MKTDDPNLKPHYRMPRVFGALPGPRNVPKDKQHLPNNQRNLVITVGALTDADALSELLPPDCALEGEPAISVSFIAMSNIGWLAGHGYSILSVGFRVRHESKQRGTLSGTFTPVVWENLTDPIVTGREELGFAKIYAELPPPIVLGNAYRASAAWHDFRFFDLTATDLEERTPLPAPADGSFHYKFVPKTSAQGEADVAYLEYAPPVHATGGFGGLPMTRQLAGRGTFAFHATRWEDVPFQYPIINALAALPILERRTATVTYSAATGTIGDPGSQPSLIPLLPDDR